LAEAAHGDRVAVFEELAHLRRKKRNPPVKFPCNSPEDQKNIIPKKAKKKVATATAGHTSPSPTSTSLLPRHDSSIMEP
jgi:hypothetical protein